MTEQRKLILLANDDGYSAPGINRLMEWLTPIADVFVMAPDRARSGAAGSITSEIPITCNKISEAPGLTVYSCSGTPVDCVKLAVDEIMPRRPDLVVSGINHGDNATINVHYSGTMGAALEAAMLRLKSVAFSLCDHRLDADFTPLRPYVERITREALMRPMPELTCLNVNFPLAPEFEGVRICRMCKCLWSKEYEKYTNPRRGNSYYFLTGNCTNMEPDREDTDRWALEHGYVAITPTQIDVTAYHLAEDMKNWDIF